MDLPAVLVFLVISSAEFATGYDTSNAFIGRLGRRNHKKIYDDVTGVNAIKDHSTEKCYVRLPIQPNHVQTVTQHYVTPHQLQYMAGPTISKFCEGYPAYIITTKSNIKKRSTQHYFVGRRRGQTQSQYLNFGSSNEPGKAEAEFTVDGSRAVVTGSNGMGQAQSQSGTSDCGDCRTQEQTLHYGRPGGGDVGAERYVPGGEIRRPGEAGEGVFRPSAAGGGFDTVPSRQQQGVQGPTAGTPYNGKITPGQDSFGRLPSALRPEEAVAAPQGAGPGRFQVQGQGVNGQRPSVGGYQNGRFPPPQSSSATSGQVPLGGGPQGPGTPGYPGVLPGGGTDGRLTSGVPSSAGQVAYPGVQDGGRFAVTQPGAVVPGQEQVRGPYGGPQGPSGYPAATPETQGYVTSGQPGAPGFITGAARPAVQQQTFGPQSTGGVEQYPSSVVQPGAGAPSYYQQPSGQVNGRTPVQQGQFPTGPQQQFETAGSRGQYPQQGQVTGGQRGQFSGQFAGNYVPDSGQAGRFSGTFAGQYEGQAGVAGQYGGQPITTQGGQYGPGYAPGVAPGSAQQGQFQGSPVPVIPSPGSQYIPTGPGSGQGQPSREGQFIQGPYPQGGYIPGQQAGQGEAGQYGAGGRPSVSQGQSAGFGGGYAPGIDQGRGYGTGTGGQRGGGGYQLQPEGYSPEGGGQYISQYPGQDRGVQVQPAGGGGAGTTQFQPGVGGTGGTQFRPAAGGGEATQFAPGGGAAQFRPDTSGTGATQFGPGGGPTQYPPTVGGGGATQFRPDGSGAGVAQFGPAGGPTQYPLGGGGGATQFRPDTSGTAATQFGPGGGPTQYLPSAGGGGTTQFRPDASGVEAGRFQTGSGGATQFAPGTGVTQYGPSQVGGETQYGPAVQGPYGPEGGASQQYGSGGGQYGPQYGPNAVGPQQFPDQGIYTPAQQFGQAIRQDQAYPGGTGYELTGGVAEDDSDSQAQSSVQQINNETQAAASAQGTFGGGTAQSQVQGTYFGTGSFTASAGTSDGRRGAQTQISGGDSGVLSSAQGTGGLGQSQAQVLLSSKTGETTSNAQSGGYNHGTNSQVQANEKGGMADAQANGPGNTSSQAQIGFTPYNENDADDQETPFKGGGTASAQGGSFSGQTQSQITGKFRFGIKYTGSAQAQSGGSSAPGNVTAFKPFTPLSFANLTKQTHSSDRQNFSGGHLNKNLRQPVSSTTLRYEAAVQGGALPPDVGGSTSETPEYYDETEYDEDYEDEDKHKIGTKSITQTSGNQKQHIILDPLEDLDANVHQAHGDDELKHGTVLQPGQQIPGSSGYRIPQGFRGKVISLANGANTAAFGPNSQAQSVTLKPGSGKVIYSRPLYQLGSRTHLYNGNYGYGSGYTYQPVTYKVKSGKSLPNFVAVTKSETGSQDLYTGKRTPSVYYSQSSTCGYFTNTCVFNGKTKVCTPKPKTNPDGTPVIC